MPPTVSVQGKCRSVIYNNIKGDHDLGRFVIQTQMFFDELVGIKKVLLYSSHCIDTHIYVVVEVIDVHRCVSS